MLRIVPLGSVPDELCRLVGDFLEEMLGPPFSIAAAREAPVHSYHPIRGQYMAFRLLEFLEEAFPGPSLRTMGITDLDLCTPVLTHVYGLARLGGRTCIVSTFRLQAEFQGLAPDLERFHQRVLKESLHELGHTCGLKHCSVDSCIMHFAHSTAQIDRRRLGYCDACREKVEQALAEDAT